MSCLRRSGKDSVASGFVIPFEFWSEELRFYWLLSVLDTGILWYAFLWKAMLPFFWTTELNDFSPFKLYNITERWLFMVSQELNLLLFTSHISQLLHRVLQPIQQPRESPHLRAIAGNIEKSQCSPLELKEKPGDSPLSFLLSVIKCNWPYIRPTLASFLLWAKHPEAGERLKRKGPNVYQRSKLQIWELLLKENKCDFVDF